MNPRFEKLNAQLAEWQSLHPFKREDHDRLWRKLRLDWNYHSNHIEGNTLTYGETEILLIHGQATGDHGLRDYMEMKAHDVAIEHLKVLVREERPLTEADIRDFNRILIKDPFWKDAITPDGQASHIEILPGEYKKQPNNVRTASGEIFRFADPADVSVRMSELVAWLREALEKRELHPIEIASRLHHDFVLIHPFGDGNGRTARILVNYVLMLNGYLPLIVPTGQKDRYLAALRRADAGDLDALTDYLTTCAETSMDGGIRAAKGESIEEPDDLSKEIELFKRGQRNPATEIAKRETNTVSQVIRDNLIPLFSELVHELRCFDDLFHETRLEGTPKLIAGDLGTYMQTNTYMTEVLHHTQIIFIHRLIGFKGGSDTPFDVESYLFVHFNEYNYEISMDEPIHETFRYGEILTEENRNKIVKDVVKYAFTRIKKLSGEA